MRFIRTLTFVFGQNALLCKYNFCFDIKKLFQDFIVFIYMIVSGVLYTFEWANCMFFRRKKKEKWRSHTDIYQFSTL
jgi:hypothetical protein